MTVFVLELLSRRDDARMIVAESQRSETTEEIEDLPPGLVGVVHARGGFDLDLVEAQKLHEMQLAGIDVILEQLGHFGDRHRFRVRDGQQIGTLAALCCCLGNRTGIGQGRCVDGDAGGCIKHCMGSLGTIHSAGATCAAAEDPVRALAA